MFKRLIIAFAALLFAPLQADAAPLVGLFTAAASAIGSTALGAAAISAGLSYGLSWLYQKFFGESNVQGVRQKLETGGDKPLSFLWGTTATAGKLVYFNQHGEDNDIDNIWLTLVIALSDLPIHGLSNYLWVNGERCTIDFNETNPHGFHPVNEYDKWGSKYLWIKFYDGTQTQADPFLKSNYGNDPTRPFKDDMVGRGVAYAILICHFSAKGLWSGVPTFLFPAKGIKLYDLRKDSTAGGSGPQRWNDQSTWTWSDNLAVAKYNFIRGVKYDGKWVWGGQKVNAWRLPADNWIAAMNVCDQQVDKKNGPGVVNVARYAGGGEISVNTPALGVINELDKCSSGHTTEIGGIFKTWVGPPGLSVYSFTDDDIIITEAQEDSLFRPLQETFNAANATYTEPDKGWAPKEAPARVWDNYVAEDDDQTLVADLSFPFVSEKNQVQRLMREVIHDSRRQATHLLQLPPEAWFLDPYDVVTWNSARNGYVNKKFIVASIDDLPNCNQLVSLREVNASDYDWDVTYELDSEVGPISAVKPGTFNKLFSVEPGTIDDENGPRRPAITLLWDWADTDMDVKAIQFKVRRKNATKIIKQNRTDDPTDGIHQIVGQAILPNKIYQVRARAIPITPGRESDWSVWMDVTTPDIKFSTSDIGDGAIGDAQTDGTAPAVPTGLTLVQTAKDVDEDGKVDIAIKATWAAAAGAKSYALKITQGADVSHVQSDDLVHIFKAKSAKSYSVQVRSISFNGTKSALSNAVSLTPSKKSAAVVAPTSLTVKGNSKRNKLAWSESSEKDYKFTRIYRSTNSTWASAILLDKVAGTAFVDDDLKPGTTYYYYVAHVDQSGNASSVYPASTGAGISGTTNRSVDLTNIVANPDFVDGADGLDGWYPSTYQDAVSEFAPGASPPYAQAVYIPSRNAGFNELPWAGWSPTIPCNPGDVFYAECWVYSPATVDTQFRLTMRIGNSINTTYTHRTLAQDPTSGTWIKVSGKMTVPDTVGGHVSSKVTIMVTNANTGTAVLGWYVTGVVFRRAVDATIIVDGAVGNTALASGAVSEAKLASGRSSNLLLNTDARLGKEFFAKVWDANNDITFTIRNDGIWNPRGHPSFELYQPNASITSKCDIHAVDISGVTDMEFPVIPGQRYEASAYFGSHRCTGEIIILFRKSNGLDASGSYWNSSGGSDIAKGGGVSLSGYQRLGVFAVAPADAASAVIIVRKNPTIAGFGYTNSYLFFTRMFFAEAGSNQTEFSPWVNSGGSYVNSNMILAGAVDKAKFASGLSVPEVVAALPSSGNYAGRMAFLTTDNKLYRYTGGAWVATVAAVDVTGTLSDAQLSAISAIKVTGQLSDTQIASLTAAKLTGQITNTQISDNSISTPKLQAGAITANEIAAGAITTSKLAVGSGANMIKNSDMRAGITGWGVENTSNVNLFTVTLRTDAYGPEPGALQIYQIDGTQSVFYGICPYANGAYEKYAVTPGKFYELSFYYLGHRCSYVAGHIQWIDAAGAHISYSGTGGIAGAQNTNPGKSLANFQRAWGVFQAPANAVSCRPFIRHGGTQSGQSDSYLFITRVYLGEANANQTEKTPWSPAGTTLIENGNIAASAVTADKIAANTITAAQIAANTITASKIATGTITATQIAANTVTAAEIAANAVTANELAANAVIAGKIQAGAIGAAEIAANAVTADKLSVTNLAAISASLGNVDISLANIGTLTVGTINIANGAVTAGKTDQTTPGVPTGLTLVQTAKDVDEDGKVDIAIKATWNSATNAKSYALKITQGSDVSYVQSDDLSHIFKAKSGKSYSVQVRSISFNGTKSALSAAVSLTPAKKNVAPTAAAGLTASFGRHKRIRLAWTACPDKDYAYTEIWRGSVMGWANASLFAQVKGDSFIDDTVGNGVSQFYWIRHVDTSGNVGAYYPDAGNIAGSTTTLASGDFGDNSVSTATVQTSAVTDQATSATGGGITVSGASTTMQTVTSNHGAGAEAVLLIGQFKNNSNNTIAATLSFTGDSQGTLYETGTINIGPKQLINVAYMYKNPSGSSSTFNFKVNNPDIAFNANDRRLMAIANKK